MTVKAAVGETGRLHHVGDADAAKSIAAKQRVGRVDDPFTNVRPPSRGSRALCISAMRSSRRLDTLYDGHHQSTRES